MLVIICIIVSMDIIVIISETQEGLPLPYHPELADVGKADCATAGWLRRSHLSSRKVGAADAYL